jgi:hypothetical protein
MRPVSFRSELLAHVNNSRRYSIVDIDGENHAALTMVVLSAVKPEGCRCIDLDLELRDFVALSLHHLVSVSRISSTSGCAGGSGTAAGNGGCSNRLEA